MQYGTARYKLFWVFSPPKRMNLKQAEQAKKMIRNPIPIQSLSNTTEIMMYSACCRQPGAAHKRTKMTPSFSPAKERRERGTEDRERSVGNRNIPASTYLPSSHSPPPSTYPEPERRGGGSQPVDPWTRKEGRGAASQLAHLRRR